MKAYVTCPHCGGQDLYDIEVSNTTGEIDLKCHWEECERLFLLKFSVILNTRTIK